MSTERIHDGPSASVPTPIWAEPPPTSQTATDDGSRRADETAPRQASAPSSCALSTRVGAAVTSTSRDTSSRPFSAWRPGEVTSTSTAEQRSLRARCTLVAAVAAVSSSFFSEMRPVCSICSPSPSWTRSSRTATSRSLSRAATSRRTVLAPTSTIPTLTSPILAAPSAGKHLPSSRRMARISAVCRGWPGASRVP